MPGQSHRHAVIQASWRFDLRSALDGHQSRTVVGILFAQAGGEAGVPRIRHRTGWTQ